MAFLTVIVKKTGNQKKVRDKYDMRYNKKNKKLIITTDKEILRFDIDKIELCEDNVFINMEDVIDGRKNGNR